MTELIKALLIVGGIFGSTGYVAIDALATLNESLTPFEIGMNEQSNEIDDCFDNAKTAAQVAECETL